MREGDARVRGCACVCACVCASVLGDRRRKEERRKKKEEKKSYLRVGHFTGINAS